MNRFPKLTKKEIEKTFEKLNQSKQAGPDPKIAEWSEQNCNTLNENGEWLISDSSTAFTNFNTETYGGLE